MPSYTEERDAVSRLRAKRESFSPRSQHQRSSTEQDNAAYASSVAAAPAPAPVVALQPINASYDDVMSLIGPTNYATMVELFRGSGGLPDGIHPEVTVSFELFEAIQKRLVSTRDELEGCKKELLLKSQHAVTMQSDLQRANEKIVTLSRELRQSEDLCLELRRYSSDASILKQQHEQDIIACKDEIASLVTRLNLSEKQVMDAHYKVSDALVQLAQKDALIASLKRGRRASAAVLPAGTDVTDAAGAEPDVVAEGVAVAAGRQNRSRSIVGLDRAFQEQLKMHIAQLEKEKKVLEGEVQDVLDMHEGYRHHAEGVICDYERKFMFYEDCFASHRCHDELQASAWAPAETRSQPRMSQASAMQAQMETWVAKNGSEIQNIGALLNMCLTGVDLCNDSVPIPADSDFYYEVKQSADSFASVTRGCLEAVRLLERLDSHMSNVVSIGEFRDSWKRIQAQWVDLIRRLLHVGIPGNTSAMASVLEKEAVFKKNVERGMEDKWVRIINAQYKIVAPVRDAQVATECEMTDNWAQAGAGFFTERLDRSTATAPRAVMESKRVQTELTGTPSSVSLVAAGVAAEAKAKQDSNTFMLDASDVRVSSAVLAKLQGVFSSLLQCGRLVRSNVPAPSKSGGKKTPHVSEWCAKPLVDPLTYFNQFDGATPVSLFGVAGAAVWVEDILDGATLLVKAMSALLADDSECEGRYALYQRFAELQRLERTVELVGKKQSQQFDSATRSDVANYNSSRKRLHEENAKFDGLYDDGSLLKSIRVALQAERGLHRIGSITAKSKADDSEAPKPPLTVPSSSKAPGASRHSAAVPAPVTAPTPPRAAKTPPSDRVGTPSALTPRLGITARFEDSPLPELPGDDDAAGRRSSTPSRTSVADVPFSAVRSPAPPVSVSPTRRIPFQQTSQDKVVEQVRANAPVTAGPSLTTKIGEAFSFADGQARREAKARGESNWASAATSKERARSPDTKSVSDTAVSPVVSPRANSNAKKLALAIAVSSTIARSPRSNAGATVVKPPSDDGVSSGEPSSPQTALPLISSLASSAASPKATPRPPMQTPAKTVGGKFNVVDSSFFYVAKQPSDEILPSTDDLPAAKRGKGNKVIAASAGFDLGVGGKSVSIQPSPPASPEPHRASSPPLLDKKGTLPPSAMERKKGSDTARPTSPQRVLSRPTSPCAVVTIGALPAEPTTTRVPKNIAGRAPQPAGGPTGAQILDNVIAQQRRQQQSLMGSVSLMPDVIMSRSALGTMNKSEAGARDESPTKRSTSPSNSRPSASAFQPKRVAQPAKPTRPLASIGMPMGSPLPEDPALQNVSTIRVQLPPGSAGSATEDVDSSPVPRRGVHSSAFGGRLVSMVEDPVFVVAGVHKGPPPGSGSSSKKSDGRSPTEEVTTFSSPHSQPHQTEDLNPFRPTNNTVVTTVVVGNTETTVYRQTVHGHQPKRVTGADIMNDMIRKQREAELAQLQESLQELDRGVTNSASPRGSLSGASSMATSGRGGTKPNRAGGQQDSMSTAGLNEEDKAPKAPATTTQPKFVPFGGVDAGPGVEEEGTVTARRQSRATGQAANTRSQLANTAPATVVAMTANNPELAQLLQGPSLGRSVGATASTVQRHNSVASLPGSKTMTGTAPR